MRTLLLAVILATPGEFTINSAINTEVHSVDHFIIGGSATLGPTAPTFVANGDIRGLGFNADGETIHLGFEIPNAWDGADIGVKVYWFVDSGDAMADTEDLDWNFKYRSIVWGTEDLDNGTAKTLTVTRLQSGAGDDQDTFIDTLTMAYNDGDQPLTAGDVVTGVLWRNVSAEANSYSGHGIIHHVEIDMSHSKLKSDHY